MTQKITLFAEDTDDGDRIAEATVAVDGVSLTRKDCSLTVANGTAHALAAAGEIVLFRTNASNDGEIGAVQELCAASEDSKVIAITDADMPLSEVKRYMQAGVADVLPMPVEPEDLKRSLAALQPAVVAPALALNQRGRIITVAQSRGGIGSTTLAVNLAEALRGKTGLLKKTEASRVAIVDLDLQFGGIASFLDVEPNDALRQLATDGIIPDATFLNQALVQSKDGLSVLTAPTEFVPLESLAREQIDALIEQLSLAFDYVVIDLPRTLVHWVQAVLNRSDQMLLVTDSTVPAIRQSKRLIGAYADENPTLPIEIVINHEAKPMIRGRHHVQAAKLLERELSYWLPPDPKVAREALDRGVPLSQVANRARLTKAISKIAHDIRSNPAATTAAAPASEGRALTFASRKTKEGNDRV